MPKKLIETASGKVSYLTNLLPFWEKKANRCQHRIRLTISAFSKGLQFFCFRIFAPINQLDEARNTQKNNQRTIYKKAGSKSESISQKGEHFFKKTKTKNCISYKNRTWPKIWCWNVLFLVSSLLPGVVFWREREKKKNMINDHTLHI